MSYRYSELKVYEQCPLRWQLDNVILGTNENRDPTTKPLKTGMLAHEIMAARLKNVEFDNTIALMMYDIEILQTAIQSVDAAYDKLAKILDKYDSFDVEVALQRQAFGTVFTGTPDIMAYNESGALACVIDFKTTGWRSYTRKHQYMYSRQLEYYTWLIQAAARLPIAGYYVIGSHKYRESSVVPVNITEDAIVNLHDWLCERTITLNKLSAHDSRLAMPVPGEHCVYCNYNLTCDGGRGKQTIEALRPMELTFND